jgi:glyoxylate reductase
VKLLATCRLPGPAWDEVGAVEYLPARLPEGLGGPRRDVEALAVVHEHIDAVVLDLLPRLVLVANYGVGYDTVDVAECARRGVAVTNTPGVLDETTADMTFALILACRRGVVWGDRMVRRGDWTADIVEAPLADEVSGSTLGIVGMGRIGRAVARRARAFRMRVLYTSRTRPDRALELELGIEPRTLAELMAESDIVTLHCPLTDHTRGLIGGAALARMRDGSCLINTARGALVDEAALIAELRSGRIQAGLDVFWHEPAPAEALSGLRNVVLTPHIATATAPTRFAMTRVLVDNLHAAAAGRPLITPVTP